MLAVDYIPVIETLPKCQAPLQQLSLFRQTRQSAFKMNPKRPMQILALQLSTQLNNISNINIKIYQDPSELTADGDLNKDVLTDPLQPKVDILHSRVVMVLLKFSGKLFIRVTTLSNTRQGILKGTRCVAQKRLCLECFRRLHVSGGSV